MERQVFDILHGNLRQIVKILDHNRKALELWLSVGMLMTAACFFYANFMEMETNFEKLLWLGAVAVCSGITIFIFGLFIGMTWAKMTVNDLKESD